MDKLHPNHIDSSGLNHLKNMARQLKKDSGITYTNALEEVSKAHGYKNWNHVRRFAEQNKQRAGDIRYNTFNSYTSPTRIYSGQGALEQLDILTGRRAFVVSDNNLRQNKVLKRIEQQLRKKGFKVKSFSEVESGPSIDTALKAADKIRSFNPDLIVGFGGGSPLDVGKVAWAFYEHPDLQDLSTAKLLQELENLQLRQKARYVAIPTTSGSGSEVSRYAMLTDLGQGPPNTVRLTSTQMISDMAFVDPGLTLTMSEDVTADSGFGAFVKALEGYVLNKTNPLVETFALSAAQAINEWLVEAYEMPFYSEARYQMQLASMNAGLAFSNGRIGAASYFAFDIGSLFNISYGRAAAMLLCPVLAALYPNRKNRLSELASCLGIRGRGYKGKTENLLIALDKLKQRVGIPTSFDKLGVDRKNYFQKIDLLIESNSARPEDQIDEKGQPEPSFTGSPDHLKELFEHAWKGTWAAT